ncbi:MAG: N-acetyltransferase [Bacteroidales bacterium]|nr:N-acetyltransferase [Bacteroidales bacterium]MCM1146846.1 N-acetyltransferase [Bacteroidales bacterium]MCM1205656.1 N-acetyltransferase [Bacillota bacterium]MCM1510232.1 hypothetical protein [Clostridium sp.]
MTNIEIRKVETKKDLKQFIDFHYDLYKGSPYDVLPLYGDEVDTLSEDRNAAFEFCEAEYYMAFRDGKLAGRVAAIINHKANGKWGRKDVRFGWIDFVEDKAVVEALLGAVANYGRRHGMEQMAGPLGFTDMDSEGMLVHGFDELSTIATLYNYEYYPKIFEEIGGFEVDNRYNEYNILMPEKMPEKHRKISEMVMKRYNLHIRKVKRRELFGKENIGHKVFSLINDTYKDLYGYSELTDRQIKQLVSKFSLVLDMNLVTLVEDWNTPGHDIVGVGITVPSMAKVLQKCRRGRLLPFGWFHLLRFLLSHKSEGIDLLLIGVLPEYRNKGVNALFFYDLIPYFLKYGVKWAETQLEMETNTAVQGQWDMFEHRNHKKRVCWKKKI